MKHRFLIFLFLSLNFLIWSPVSRAAPYEPFATPALRVLNFKDLHLPSQLTRDEVSWMLQTAADDLYETAFVDLGSMSDFMHMHVIFRPKNAGLVPPKDLMQDFEDRFDWSQMELRGSLIHTQEYPMLRKGKPYKTRAGVVLDHLMRNWVLWQGEDSFPKGNIVRAHEWSEIQYKDIPFTVYAGDLRKDLFGEHPGDWEVSIYFFRVGCEQVDALPADVKNRSNLIEVKLPGERACLNVVNFHCRNHADDQTKCGNSPELLPYYP
jgi:hypothetical protein